MRNPQHGLLVAVVLLLVSSAAAADTIDLVWQSKVQATLFEEMAGDEVEFLVFFEEQASLGGLDGSETKEVKGQFVYDALTEVASRTQQGIVAELEALEVEYRSYWVANMVWVRGAPSLIERMARREDVRAVFANRQHALSSDPVTPSPGEEQARDGSPLWNLVRIGAPLIWADGVLGQNTVIGCIDTGVEWQHPALISQYRGWNGTTADHDYNWHDAIHSGNGGDCGLESPEPCDDFPHGTPVLGIALGDDSVGNRIGVAPGAQWIGCRCMDVGEGSVARYSECLEWMIAPTDLNGMNPDPALAPDVVNNSWICVDSEGCTDPLVLETVIENVRSAGIVVIAGAGNEGPNCSSLAYPPATLEGALTVGASDSLETSPLFSSRGPAPLPAGDLIKPNIVAPGVDLTSSAFGTYFSGLGGTSYAGPHAAGAVALLISANPALAGEVALLETLLEQNALSLTTDEGCGGLPADAIPNNTFGWGRLDAKAAYDEAVGTTGAGDAGVPERGATLLAHYPNPVRGVTEIVYDVPAAARVSLGIYGVQGRLVRSVVRTQDVGAGRYHATWDGKTAEGIAAPRGVYFLRLELDSSVTSQKLVIVE